RTVDGAAEVAIAPARRGHGGGDGGRAAGHTTPLPLRRGIAPRADGGAPDRIPGRGPGRTTRPVDLGVGDGAPDRDAAPPRLARGRRPQAPNPAAGAGTRPRPDRADPGRGIPGRGTRPPRPCAA